MRRLVLACAAVTLLACGGGDSTGPVASAEGTWSLQTVGGTALPYTYAYDAVTQHRAEVLSDVFVFSADGSYTETFTTRDTQGTTVTTETATDAGTWSQSGKTVTVTFSDGSHLGASINGDQISMNTAAGVLLYARQ
ncbi:MAG TPA: lipocalin family protein [Gemmatimonadaceae bacterium]